MIVYADSLKKQIYEHTGGEGVEVVIECSGNVCDCVMIFGLRDFVLLIRIVHCLVYRYPFA